MPGALGAGRPPRLTARVTAGSLGAVAIRETFPENRRMAEQWFVGKGGARSGPFSWELLREMAAGGRLAPTDLVWREGMAGWVPASSVAQLFAPRPQPVAAVPDSANPYAAPVERWDAGVVAQVVPGIGRSYPPYSFSTALDLAFKTFKSEWGLVVVIGLIWLGVNILVGVPQYIIQFVGQASGDPDVVVATGLGSTCLGYILNILVGGPMFAGVIVAGANAVGGGGKAADTFLGFKRYGRVLVANILVMLVWLGIGLVAAVPMVILAMIGGAVGAANGNAEAMVALFVIIGVVLMLLLFLAGMALVGARVFFAPAIVADPALGSLGVMDAVRLNWSRTSPGRGFSLLGLALLVGLLAGLSAACFCIPYILVGLPIIACTLGAAHTLLFRSNAAPTPRVV